MVQTAMSNRGEISSVLGAGTHLAVLHPAASGSTLRCMPLKLRVPLWRRMSSAHVAGSQGAMAL